MGPAAGNPFTGSSLHAGFRLEHRTVTVDGFYDGEAKWRVRFMPDEIGEWTYTTRSSTPELNGATGQFQCVNPSTGNHGPVAVSETYLSAYADGARYVVLGD